ncbi:MAG: thioredoxin domain-containing protein [Myxococcota bacterium]
MSRTLARFSPPHRVHPALVASCIAFGALACGGGESNDAPVIETVDVPAPRPGDEPFDLPGIDTSGLRDAESRRWRRLVSSLTTPCGQPETLRECVEGDVTCGACVPASRYLLRLVAEGEDTRRIRELYRLRYDGEPTRIDTMNAPIRGAGGSELGAEVTIVEFSDFECPYCGAAAPLLERLLEELEGDVRLVFMHYPLSGHEHAFEAAKASVAAGRQGKFWEMHDLLFANQAALTPSDITGYAASLDLDMDRFRADLEDPEVAQAVQAQKDEGRRLGVSSTPTLYINGRRFEESPESLGAYLRETLGS